ncbi:MAG: TolC family outer membrane protein [Gammaproteobacteria bacterium]|nr:TolC family outer membrane protein [Gammaproteobacteria bacterium]MCP5299902.1 TolC family outer membrane protein [Chromatiaceae bacterium]
MKRIAQVIALLALFPTGGAMAADLTTVYGLAGENDPALRAARATRDATYEAEPLARSRLLPSVAVSGEANYTNQDVDSRVSGSYNDSFTSANGAIQATQPLYRKDRSVQLEQARDQVAQADIDYESATQDLVVRVAQAYFGVLSAQDTLEFAESEKKAIARQLDQAKQRFEVGLIAITGVHEAQARYDQSRADEILARTNVDNAIETLNEITLQAVQPLSRLKEKIPLDPPQPAGLEDWTKLALDNNPGIQSARYDAEIARKEIEVAEAGDSPALDLVGSYGINRTNADFGSDSNSALVGLQISLPLYTGGGVQASARQARYRYEAAQEVLEQRRRAVQTQVGNAYRGVVSSVSRVAALDAARVSAQSALEATEAGFEVGTRTLVDVLNGQRDLFRARRDYAQSRYDYILNTLTLLQAAGTLGEDDVTRVNSWLK